MRTVCSVACACALFAGCSVPAPTSHLAAGTDHPPTPAGTSTLLAQPPGSPSHGSKLTQAETTQKLAQAAATHEYPSPPPPRQTADQTAPNAARAIQAFAGVYINWTADTVSTQMSELAQACIGQARAEMSLIAARTKQDYELQRAGIANSGEVEAVAPIFGQRYQYVVVTREQTTATDSSAYQGLRPAWHVTVVTVAMQAPGEWTISGWEPQN